MRDRFLFVAVLVLTPVMAGGLARIAIDAFHGHAEIPFLFGVALWAIYLIWSRVRPAAQTTYNHTLTGKVEVIASLSGDREDITVRGDDGISFKITCAAGIYNFGDVLRWTQRVERV